jgi:hypothetical protein
MPTLHRQMEPKEGSEHRMLTSVAAKEGDQTQSSVGAETIFCCTASLLGLLFIRCANPRGHVKTGSVSANLYNLHSSFLGEETSSFNTNTVLGIGSSKGRCVHVSFIRSFLCVAAQSSD